MRRFAAVAVAVLIVRDRARLSGNFGWMDCLDIAIRYDHGPVHCKLQPCVMLEWVSSRMALGSSGHLDGDQRQRATVLQLLYNI